MKGIIWLTALLALVGVETAVAQAPAGGDTGARAEAQDVIERSGIATALDSVAATAAPELEEALGQLALALGELFTRVASDPELRRSAVAAAQGMVGVAQIVVVEQAEIIQEVLRTAAEEIAEASGQ